MGVSRDWQVTRGRAGDSEGTGCWGPGAVLRNDPGGLRGFPSQLAGAGDRVFVNESVGICSSQAACTCPAMGFSPSPPTAALFPFLAKYLHPAQGKSSGFRRPVSHRQECLGTRGFPLGKQMFLQQLKFCKELFLGSEGQESVKRVL